MTAPAYSITRLRTPPGTLRVVLTGTFDMSIGQALSESLVEAARLPDVTEVIVDLAHTRFIDSHVVASLVAGYQAAMTAERGFTVVNAHGIVRQVLDITGLSELLCT